MSTILPALTKDIIGKKGGLLGKILLHWPEIAGPELAALATPEKMRHGEDHTGAKDVASRQASHSGKTDSGKLDTGKLNTGKITLTLAVNSADAPQLQHRLPLLLERINMHFGYAAVTAIRLVHKPPASSPAPATGGWNRPSALTSSPSSSPAVSSSLLEKIEDEALRTALARLHNGIKAS